MNCQICGLSPNGLVTSDKRCKCPPPNHFISNNDLVAKPTTVMGMSLREYYAGLALQGIIIGFDSNDRATRAVKMADALIKALNKKEE